MIKFFVCGGYDTGHQEALARGWLPIAANRYVEGYEGPQADRHEIRMVRRLSDFDWMPGIVFVKGRDFGVCQMCRGRGTMGRRVPREAGHKVECPTCHGSRIDPEAARFESMVSSGQARWWQDAEPEPELIHGDEEMA